MDHHAQKKNGALGTAVFCILQKGGQHFFVGGHACPKPNPAYTRLFLSPTCNTQHNRGFVLRGGAVVCTTSNGACATRGGFSRKTPSCMRAGPLRTKDKKPTRHATTSTDRPFLECEMHKANPTQHPQCRKRAPAHGAIASSKVARLCCRLPLTALHSIE